MAPEKVSAETSGAAQESEAANPPGRSELENGVGLCVETSRRLACCSSLVLVSEDGQGNPLQVGRRTRRPSTALTRALKSRDRGCQFPGCTHTRYVEAHHLVHWADGGPTDLSNLVLLCSHHHRAVHEQGFKASRNQEGELVFISPGGAVLPPSPLTRPGDGEPLGHQALARAHQRAELGISAASGGPLEFSGYPFDLGDAVSLLLPDHGRI